MKMYLLAIDSHLQMWSPHEKFSWLSQFDVSFMLAKTLVSKLCSAETYGYVSVCRLHSSDSENLLSTLSRDETELHLKLDELRVESKPSVCYKSTASAIVDVLNVAYTYCGPWAHIKMIVFTQGESSCFTDATRSHLDLLIKQTGSISFLFVSLTGNQLSSDLMELHEKFQPRSFIFEAATLTENKIQNLNSFVDFSINHLIKSHLHNEISRPIQLLSDKTTCDNVLGKLVISCGLIHSVGMFLPAPGTHNITGFAENNVLLHAEIFGFLNLTDLNNAPVTDRFVVVSSCDHSESDFLHLLLTSIQTTKTIAFCNIYLTRQPLNQAEPTHNDLDEYQFWSHGFLHHLDVKQPVMGLSIFEKDRTGLSWLGNFSHLAPVTDFVGSKLYDDKNGTSPFPVRTPDHLSYRSGSRYISWTTLAMMHTDVNKVIRLGRRLPDKFTLLCKELNRICSAVQIYSCTELLHEIHKLIYAMHDRTAPALNELGSGVGRQQSGNVSDHKTTGDANPNEQPNTLTDCLEQITQMLIQKMS